MVFSDTEVSTSWQSIPAREPHMVDVVPSRTVTLGDSLVTWGELMCSPVDFGPGSALEITPFKPGSPVRRPYKSSCRRGEKIWVILPRKVPHPLTSNRGTFRARLDITRTEVVARE